MNLDTLHNISFYLDFNTLSKFTLINKSIHTKIDLLNSRDIIKFSYIINNIKILTRCYSAIIKEQLLIFIQKKYKENVNLKIICNDVKEFHNWDYWSYKDVIEYLIQNPYNYEKPIYKYALFKINQIYYNCRLELGDSVLDRCGLSRNEINNAIKYAKILKPLLVKHIHHFFPKINCWSWHTLNRFIEKVKE